VVATGATTGTVTSVLAAGAADFSFLGAFSLAGAGAGAGAGDATTASFLADLAVFLVSAVLMFDTE
jgi:hypothetical protein